MGGDVSVLQGLSGGKKCLCIFYIIYHTLKVLLSMKCSFITPYQIRKV